jgi:galactokinase
MIRERAENPAELERRLTHFVNEDARTAAAVEAFRGTRRDRIGTLSSDSQSDAERLLQNQVPETTRLAAMARTLGAFGASSFGAGFGGSVWALVQKNDAPEFSAKWLSEYRNEFPARDGATVFTAPPGPALTWLG